MTTTPEEKQSAPSLTQTGSFASARVFWLDRTAVIGRLRKAARDLVEQRPEVARVILFGSLARGDAVPGSDADLLLILADSPLPFLARSALYRPAGAGLAVDVFAYTRAELDAMLKAGNAFIGQALREGIALI
jgi:predicted nucleotidyltransferase